MRCLHSPPLRFSGVVLLLLLAAIGPADVSARPDDAALHGATAQPPEPTVESLLKRHAKEKSPVWSDGDTATFFFRGEAEEVLLLIGGDRLMMRRLPKSDVWTTTYTKPNLAKGLFTYIILPGKKGESYYGRKLTPHTWRGPQAPPAAAQLKPEEIKGRVKSVEFDSKDLGAKREVRVYLPPGHDPKKTYPVLYATDGQDDSTLLEPLITAGKLPPMIVVAATEVWSNALAKWVFVDTQFGLAARHRGRPLNFYEMYALRKAGKFEEIEFDGAGEGAPPAFAGASGLWGLRHPT